MLAIFVSFILLFILIFVFIIKGTKYKYEAPSSWIFGQIPFGMKLSNNLDTTLDEIKYKGNIIHFKILNKNYFIVNEASLIYKISFDKDFDLDQASTSSYEFLVGPGTVFTLQIGKQWTNHRRLLTPVFNLGSNLQDISTIFTVHSLRLCEKLRELLKEEKNGIIEVSDLIRRLAIQIFVHYAFGLDSNESDLLKHKQIYDAIETAITYAGNSRMAFTSFMYNLVHPYSLSKFLKARAILKQRIAQIIEEASKKFEIYYFIIFRDLKEEGKLVQQLADATENSMKFSQSEIENSTILLFFVGYDTTNASILWSLYQISRNQEVQRKLHEEIVKVLGTRTEVTFEDVKKMEYLDCVIKEVFRVYPTASAFQRTAIKSKKIGEILIPQGSSVICNLHGVHRSEEYWENSDKFIPERWLSLDKSTIREKYYPFGGGNRICIGAKVAELEMKIAIATLLKHYSIGYENKGEIERVRNVVVRPKYLFLKFTPNKKI